MVEALKRIKQLESAWGQKTLENEFHNETVEYGKARKRIARSPLLSGDEQSELSSLSVIFRAVILRLLQKDSLRCWTDDGRRPSMTTQRGLLIEA